MFIDGLHPEIMKLMSTEGPGTKKEAIKFAHSFNCTRERIDRWRRARNDTRTGYQKNSAFGKPYPGRGMSPGRIGQGGSNAQAFGRNNRRNASRKAQASQMCLQRRSQRVGGRLGLTRNERDDSSRARVKARKDPWSVQNVRRATHEHCVFCRQTSGSC
ncbi:hypothetical protein CSUI_008735 [Cystoisospora suis]|uniref:Uncharacterized protein n=1 Tax=Cystoisospora suis TaxID=483139 RepID=A0A2C6KLR8_9APIC|nr:hypothetical protein CSUI_008735 [Cystoisospora suis]